jgi:hypothetical protein
MGILWHDRGCNVGWNTDRQPLIVRIAAMKEKPKFHSKMIKNGRWTVAVTTGYGPASYVGDYATEAEAEYWISTYSKDWPQPVEKPK